MNQKAPPRQWSMPRLITFCALPVLVEPLFQYLAVAPIGSGLFLGLEVVLLLPFLVALMALFVLPFQLFSRRLRAFAIRYLIAAVVFLAAALIGLFLGVRVRTTAFEKLAERSAPLIQAIRSYEAQHGAPPPDLDALVPGFLPSVPRTGMAAYPEYGYFVTKTADEKLGNPWVIIINTPSGGINFDEFMYFPLQNYPEKGYGGSLQRIRDWAYLHE